MASQSVASPAARRYLTLKSARGIGPVLARRLIRHFGDVDAVLEAPVSALTRVPYVSPERARQIRAAQDGDAADRETALAAERGVRIICERDADYPPALRFLPDPPICLYAAGRFERADTLAMAVVGTRRCTGYGREQARRFGALLARAGFTVVSGLARGVDGAAHQGALEAGGRTMAVLGNGLSAVYPPEHASLAERIRQRGAVMSELPMGAPPDAANFEPRNRIIAGLCLGVLVVEAARRSGALLTARFASEYDREVFAVPGRVDTPEAGGTNALIRDGGAKLVACLDDVLDELGDVGRLVPFSGDKDPDTPNAAPALRTPLDAQQRAVLGALGRQEMSIETLADETGLPVPQVMSAVMALQLCGLAREVRGNLFVSTGRAGIA
jgi:DNA processing protein